MNVVIFGWMIKVATLRPMIPLKLFVVVITCHKILFSFSELLAIWLWLLFVIYLKEKHIFRLNRSSQYISIIFYFIYLLFCILFVCLHVVHEVRNVIAAKHNNNKTSNCIRFMWIALTHSIKMDLSFCCFLSLCFQEAIVICG